MHTGSTELFQAYEKRIDGVENSLKLITTHVSDTEIHQTAAKKELQIRDTIAPIVKEITSTGHKVDIITVEQKQQRQVLEEIKGSLKELRDRK